MIEKEQKVPLPGRRRIVWGAFWFVLVVTPIWALFVLKAVPAAPFWMSRPNPESTAITVSLLASISGTFVAGMILSILLRKHDEGFVAYGVVLGAVFTIVYFLAARVCLRDLLPNN